MVRVLALVFCAQHLPTSMWTKANTKTWRHANGAVISDESHSMYGNKSKTYHLYKNDTDYNAGRGFLEFATLKESKQSTAVP